jgi:hypothetical protein
MVDRDDWLMGEDIPPDALGGRDAIRDLANPKRLGQPDHAKDWVKTCADNEGVHTNSGIPNKAYYLIAGAISKEKAERIFYRTLTVYMQPTSSLQDARAKALQAAKDLYGAAGAEYAGVTSGFNAVGIDATWNPPANSCTCAATVAVATKSVFTDAAAAVASIATLYRVRDQILGGTAAGRHYRDLYYHHTDRMSTLILADSALRESSARVVQALLPPLALMVEGDGDRAVVDQGLVDQVKAYLIDLAEADRKTAGGELAAVIDAEMLRIEWDELVGMSYDEAWDAINARLSTPIRTIHIPVLVR